MNIKYSDLVLEIGPGAYPFWRSDCLADVFDETSDVDLKQFGGAAFKTKGKPLFKIIDGLLPFKDNSFDYVICSHVFEHVPVADLPTLVHEIMRVAQRAYIEFPRPMLDYIYNYNVHLNLMDIVNNEIICIDKKNTSISSVNKFQEYALYLRTKDLFSVDEYIPEIIAVGKEFTGNIPLRIVENELDFWRYSFANDYYKSSPSLVWQIRNKFHPKRISKSIFGEKSAEFFAKKIK